MLVGIPSQTVSVYTASRPIFLYTDANLHAKVHYQVLRAYTGVAIIGQTWEPYCLTPTCATIMRIYKQRNFQLKCPLEVVLSKKCVLFTDLKRNIMLIGVAVLTNI